MPECFPKSKPNVNSITTTTVLCYLQTYFMLLVAVHQSLNNKMVEISKHSQFQLPITTFPQTNCNDSSSSSSTTSSLAPCSCAGPSPPQWGGCQSPGYAWERSGCMCMLVGGLFMRTVGKLEEVVYRAKGCGDLGIVSSWGKKRSAIILRKIALLIVKIQKSTVIYHVYFQKSTNYSKTENK